MSSTTAEQNDTVPLDDRDDDKEEEITLFHIMELPRPTLNELGVPLWEVSSSALKRAYHKLSLRHHPDKHGNTLEAQRKFTTISEAYTTLSDSQLRKEYIRQYAQALSDVRVNTWSDSSKATSIEAYAARSKALRQQKEVETRKEVDAFASKMQEKLRDKLYQLERANEEKASRKRKQMDALAQRLHDQQQEGDDEGTLEDHDEKVERERELEEQRRKQEAEDMLMVKRRNANKDKQKTRRKKKKKKLTLDNF